MISLALLLLSSASVEYRFWIDPCVPAESACKPGDPELAQWALEAWERASSGGVKFVKSASRKDAQIRVTWVSQRMGLYGEARPILVNGRRGAELYVRPEMEGLGEDIFDATKKDPLLRDAIVYLTCLHESGHALGLAHTAEFNDIMYSFGFGGDIPEYFARYRRRLKSRTDIGKQHAVSKNDLARLTILLQDQ
jgi:hypothetical protein